MTTIDTIQDMREFLGDSIFGATFIKKDGTPRKGRFRLKVHKYVTGKGMAYDPADRGLVPVFDLDKDDWRMIKFDNLVELRAQGETITFK